MINVAYISHGGGPLPLLGDPLHDEMLTTLGELVTLIPKPDAIIVFSAHWEEQVVTITSSEKPELLYDYYGFPPESYEIRYPAAGNPTLAQRIYEALSKNNIEAALDDSRGLDHGVFVPLKIMYPDADIPTIQISLHKSLNAQLHIEIGSALQSLDDDNLLVIGSGFSYHNLRALMTSSSDVDNLNEEFEEWLIETMTDTSIAEHERAQRLINWAQAPHARYCHPREEHLLPLHMCYGMKQQAATTMYRARILNKLSSMYVWQELYDD